MRKPKINQKYDVITLINLLSTSMRGDLNTEQWSKYFAFDAKELVDIQDLMQKINDWHAVDNAEGTTLDLLGNDFGVARNGDNDVMYRFRIKSKRWIRLSDGTCNAIYRMVASALGIDPSDFYVHGNDLPNQIVIDNIPDEKIDNNEKTKWLMEQAENAVAFGIKVADIVFENKSFNNYNVFNCFQYETEETNVFKPNNSMYTRANINVFTGANSMTEVTNITKNIKEVD